MTGNFRCVNAAATFTCSSERAEIVRYTFPKFKDSICVCIIQCLREQNRVCIIRIHINGREDFISIQC